MMSFSNIYGIGTIPTRGPDGRLGVLADILPRVGLALRSSNRTTIALSCAAPLESPRAAPSPRFFWRLLARDYGSQYPVCIAALPLGTA